MWACLSAQWATARLDTRTSGRGRIVDQELMRITRAIRDGSFFMRPAFLQAIAHAKRQQHQPASSGPALQRPRAQRHRAPVRAARRRAARRLSGRARVHSRDHRRSRRRADDRHWVHQGTRGPHCGFRAPVAKRPRIATVCGRYWAMDRDNRWERVPRAYAMLTGRGASHPLLDPRAAAADRPDRRPTRCGAITRIPASLRAAATSSCFRRSLSTR